MNHFFYLINSKSLVYDTENEMEISINYSSIGYRFAMYERTGFTCIVHTPNSYPEMIPDASHLIFVLLRKKKRKRKKEAAFTLLFAKI